MDKYLFEKAKQKNKTVVFPEAAYSERVKNAGKYLTENKIVKVLFVGKKEDFDFEVDVVDPQSFKDKEVLIETLLEKRKSKGLTREDAEKLYNDSVYFATLLVECGYADGMVCGAETSTANTLRPALQIVKAKKGINLVSSCFVMYKKDLPFGTDGKVCLR